MFGLIRAWPGVTFLELFHVIRLDPVLGSRVGHGDLLYHLYRLKQFGFIADRKLARCRYTENGGPWGGSASGLAFLQTPPIPELARVVLERPGESRDGVWRAFAQVHPCSRQVVGYHRARLAAQGLVAVGRNGRSHAYSATPRLVHLLPLVGSPVEGSAGGGAFAAWTGPAA